MEIVYVSIVFPLTVCDVIQLPFWLLSGLFGFSRGAYTARALAGMLCSVS